MNKDLFFAAARILSQLGLRDVWAVCHGKFSELRFDSDTATGLVISDTGDGYDQAMLLCKELAKVGMPPCIWPVEVDGDWGWGWMVEGRSPREPLVRGESLGVTLLRWVVEMESVS